MITTKDSITCFPYDSESFKQIANKQQGGAGGGGGGLRNWIFTRTCGTRCQLALLKQSLMLWQY